MTTVTLDQLQAAGLVDVTAEPHLTSKGREWLLALEDVDTHDEDGGRSAGDLVLSTNGLFR